MQQELENITQVLASLNDHLPQINILCHAAPISTLIQQQQLVPFAIPTQSKQEIENSPVSMLVQRLSTTESPYFASNGTIFNNFCQVLYLQCHPSDAMPRAGLVVKFVPYNANSQVTREFKDVKMMYHDALPILQVVFDTQSQQQEEEEGTIAVYWQNIKCCNPVHVKFATFKEKSIAQTFANVPVPALESVVNNKDQFHRNALFYCYYNGWNIAAQVLQDKYGVNAQERDVFGFSALDMLSKRQEEMKRLHC